MIIRKVSLTCTAIALALYALTMPNVLTANASSECIPTDVKGSFEYTGNHAAANPVKGYFENIASNAECSDEVYVHIFGSNSAPESDGWFDSQNYVATQTISVDQGSNKKVEITIPQTDYCWYQVDATRTPVVRTPPTYFGDDMIDYVFVRNAACDVTPTPTATPSATVTPSEVPTVTPTPSSNGTSSSSSNNTSTPKTVESIQATLGTSTMASTGMFEDNVMNLSLIAGMIVSALGAISYAKDKKTSGAF